MVYFLGRYVSFINIMCYDYHYYVWYDPITEFNSPLYKHDDDIGPFAYLNIVSDKYTIIFFSIIPYHSLRDNMIWIFRLYDMCGMSANGLISIYLLTNATTYPRRPSVHCRHQGETK